MYILPRVYGCSTVARHAGSQHDGVEQNGKAHEESKIHHLFDPFSNEHLFLRGWRVEDIRRRGGTAH